MKKSSFQPPVDNAFVHWLIVHVNRWFLSSDVTWIIEDESVARWKAIPKNAGLLLAVKHVHQNDHHCLYEISERVGVRSYFISVPETFERHGRLATWFVRRLGAFPAERGGINLRATSFIVDVLSKGTAPIVLFPEGELYFLNDVVTPLKEGVAFFALEAAKARSKAGKLDSMFILPVGLRYVYPRDASRLLKKKLAMLEKKLFGAAQPGDINQRIQTLVKGVLDKAESLFQVSAEGSTCEERFQDLSRILVEGFEKEEQVKSTRGDLSDRARHFLERFRGDTQKYLPAFWAMHSLSFYPGDLSHASQERKMEVLRKCERLMTGEDTPSLPGHRLLFAEVREPIRVDAYLAEYLRPKGKQEAMQKLLADIRFSMQAAVDYLSEKSKKFLSGNDKQR